MNILITVYHALGYGGAEISTKLLAEGLERLGNKVIIASSQRYDNLNTKTFRSFKKIPFFGFHEIYLSKFLSKLIWKENIDVVYSQDRLTSIPAILAAKKNNVKSVVHFRDYWFACPYSSCMAPDYFEYDKCDWKIIVKHYKFNRWLWDLYKLNYLKRARKILETANLKLANSSAVKKRLEINGIKTNVFIMPVLRDFSKISKGESKKIKNKYNLRKKVITFIGNLTTPKGIMNMIKIMPEILNDEISFLIVGDGVLYNKIKEKNIDGVVLTGKLRYEEMADVYAASDLILLPSIWQEPLSGILLESAAMGKCVLASNSGGSRDVMKDLIDPYDLEEWKRRIKELIEDDKLRERKSREWGKEAKEKYDVDVMARRVEECLKK